MSPNLFAHLQTRSNSTMRGSKARLKTLFNCIVLFFILPLSAYPQSEDYLKKYTDSAMYVINTLKGEKRLEALDKLASSVAIHKIGLPYINMLKVEAEKQSNKRKLGNAYFYNAEHHYWITILDDSSLHYLDKIEEIDSFSPGRSPDRLRFAIYLQRKQYNSALAHIKGRLKDKTMEANSEMEALAYGDLGAIHYRLKNYEESLSAYFKALSILKNISGENVKEHEHSMLTTIVKDYISLKKYDKALNYIDSVFLKIGEIELLDSTVIDYFKDDRRSNLTKRAEVYLAMNDLVNSRKDLDKIKEESVDLTQNTNWARYLREEVQYYYQSKNYNKAYMYLEKYELLRNKFQLGDSLDSNIIKSKVLNKLNRSAEAFDLLEKTMIQIDSLNSIYVSSTIAELQVIYEVDKVKADLEIQKAYLERSKAIVIGLGCILLLSIGIVIIIRKNSKEKERKNKKIYEQYMLMKSYMDGIRSQKDNLTKQDNRDEQTDLAERVHEYIIGTKAFKNENLSRDELALTLGTNRQYLTDAIRKKTGKTFKDYINSIRLDYASQMLIENKGASIESIYIEAGFPTRSTFNRLFKEQYEMSPNELRDISRKKEELIISKAETLEDD